MKIAASLSEFKAEIVREITDIINKQTETIIMAVRPEIQAVVDAIKTLADPLAAVQAAQSDEMAQIKDLTAKVASGGQLSDDEKTALTGAVATVSDIHDRLVAATPAPAVAAAASTG